MPNIDYIGCQYLGLRKPEVIYTNSRQQEHSMTNENNFVRETNIKIKQWNAEIAKFRIIAEVANPDDQIKHYQVIEDLVSKEKAVAEKLAAFNESDAVDRSDLKNQIKHLQHIIEDAIETARIKVN